MSLDGERNMGAGDMAGTTATTGDSNTIESGSRGSSDIASSLQTGRDMTGSAATTGNENTVESNSRVSSGNNVTLSIGDSLQAIFYELGKIGTSLSLLSTRTDDRLRALESSVESLNRSSQDRNERLAHLEDQINMVRLVIVGLGVLSLMATFFYLVAR